MLGKGRNSAYTDDGREKISTLIGKETTFDGDLTSAETIRIDGVINGNCTCEKKLILGVEGQIKGNIRAQSALISGKVDGDITVDGKMELLSTGRVIGNITAKSLVIDEDAFFDGRCIMASNQAAAGQTYSTYNASDDSDSDEN